MMKTILQVEDDPNDVFFFQRAMKKAGVANPIQVVDDGQGAIDYLQGAGKFANREQFPLPCLVLLDLKLPYVMGLDVLKWIRAQPGTPPVVVMLTASSEDEDIAAAYRLGANGFLVKPSEASKMDDIVKAIHAFWLTHNALPRESYRERAAAYSRPASPAGNGAPSATGTHREEGHPMVSKQPYERCHSVDL
jgi:CheY-like chemotaxis protein